MSDGNKPYSGFMEKLFPEDFEDTRNQPITFTSGDEEVVDTVIPDFGFTPDDPFGSKVQEEILVGDTASGLDFLDPNLNAKAFMDRDPTLTLEQAEVLAADHDEKFYQKYGAPRRLPGESDADYKKRDEQKRAYIMSWVGYRNTNLKDESRSLEDPNRTLYGFFENYRGSYFDPSVFDTPGSRLRVMYRDGGNEAVLADSIPGRPANEITNKRFEPVRAAKITRAFEREYETTGSLAQAMFNISDNVKDKLPEIILSQQTGAGKFIQEMRKYVPNDFILKELAYLEASGELDFIRKSNYQTQDMLKFIFNYTAGPLFEALGWMDKDNTSTIKDANGKVLIEPGKLAYAAQQLAADTGITLEAAEAALVFSPDLVASATDVAPTVGIELSTAGAIRYGLAKLQNRGFNKWITKTTPYKSLEEAVKKGQESADELLQRYLQEKVKKGGSKFVNNFLSSMRVESIAIARSSAAKGISSRTLKNPLLASKSEFYQARMGKAANEYDAAKKALDDYTGDDTAKLKILQEKVSRTENHIRRLYAEMNTPSFMASLGKEFLPAVLGAATFKQVAQDSVGADAGAVQIAEVGGSIAGAMMPNTLMKVYTAPVMLTINGSKAIINIANQALLGGEAIFELSNVPASARSFVANLQTLDAEAYEGVVEAVTKADEYGRRMREVVDPNTGERLFRDEDIDLTIAELVNLPLLRIYQEAMDQTGSVTDITTFNEKAQQLSNLLQKEQISLDRMGQALSKLSDVREKIPVAFEDVDSLIADMTSLHTALKGDLEKRLTELGEVFDEAETEALGYLTGTIVQTDNAGKYIIPDWETAFEMSDQVARAKARMNGFSENEVADLIQEKARERLRLLVAAGDAFKSSKSFNPGVLAYAKIHHIKKVKEGDIDKKYRDWEQEAGEEDTYMDLTWLFEDLVQNGGEGLDDEVLSTIVEGNVKRSVNSDAANPVRVLYGDALNASQRRALDGIFGEAAKRDLEQIELGIGNADAFVAIKNNAGITDQDNNLTQWIKIRDYAINATKETIADLSATQAKSVSTVEKLVALGDTMRLPISPKEMRLVGSAFGDAEYNASRKRITKGVLENQRFRKNIYALSEMEESGFRRDFYGEAEFVGEKLTKKLRVINQEFVDDIVNRYRKGSTVKGWTLKADGTKATADTAEYEFRKGQGPASLWSNLARDLDKASEEQFYGLFNEPLAMAFGGRRGRDPRTGLDTYLLDAANEDEVGALKKNLELAVRRHLAQSKTAKSLLENVDPDSITDVQRKYLEKIVLAEDPDSIIKALVTGDDSFLTAVESLQVHTFDANGNIIKSESLIDMDAVLEPFSFKNLQRVNKEVQTLSDKAQKEIISKRRTLQADAETQFKFENRAKIAGEALASRYGKDAEGRKNLYEAVISDEGLDTIAELRQQHIDLTLREATEKGITGSNLDELLEVAGDAFDVRIRRDLAEHINTAVGIGGEVKGQRTLTVNTNVLDNLIGAENGTTQMKRTRENLIALMGEKHYGDIRVISDFMARRNMRFGGARITGEARSLSIESWLSRIYSISRGVVSPRYVFSEFMIMQFRKTNQSIFKTAMSDPDVARAVSEMIRTGDIPEGEVGDRFYEAMSGALARGARYMTDDEDEVQYNVQPAENQLLNR